MIFNRLGIAALILSPPRKRRERPRRRRAAEQRDELTALQQPWYRIG
jgi:hypothetical protein